MRTAQLSARNVTAFSGSFQVAMKSLTIFSLAFVSRLPSAHRPGQKSGAGSDGGLAQRGGGDGAQRARDEGGAAGDDEFIHDVQPPS